MFKNLNPFRLCLIFIIISKTVSAKTIYVNAAAAGANNGTSWVNAYNLLSQALGQAKNTDTVKVAEGFYVPTTGISETTTFAVRDSMVMLGGYPSSGNPGDADRNWVNHPTILSGKLNDSYNSYHVVTLNNLHAALLDGFIIRDGDGNGAPEKGSGLRIFNSSGIAVRNTVFQNNYTDAVFIQGSTVLITAAVLAHNSGAALNNASGSVTSLINCIVSGSAGILNQDASISIINCDIVNNSTGFQGIGTGKATIKNSIFWNNKFNDISEEHDLIPGNETNDISHCITQTYYDTTINSLLVNNNPRFVNCVNPEGPDGKFFTTDDGLQLTAPCSPGLNAGDNSFLTGITSDILGFPRIFNAGLNDLGAYERQSLPGIPLKTVFVNNSAANTGNGDGSSWKNAFKSMQDAFLYCADTIKIAEGTYLTTNNKVDSGFVLENRKVLLGGYPATGFPTDAQRNPDNYFTIFKGYAPGTTTPFKPVMKAYYNDSTTILDGIRFAIAYDKYSSSYSALSISYRSKVKLINCDFRLYPDKGISSSGVIVSKSSNPVFLRSKFNTYMHTNGGTALQIGSGSGAKLFACSFIGTRSGVDNYGESGSTAAISVGNASAFIDSCTFSNDFLSTNGVMVTTNNSTVDISRSLFRNFKNNGHLIEYKNLSGGEIKNSTFKNINFFAGTSIYIDNSSPVFTKCLFDSSRLNMYNLNGAAPVINNCVSMNAQFMYNSHSFPQINNCTVVNTYVEPNAVDASSEIEIIENHDSTVLNASNSIFWSNKLLPGSKDILNDSSSSTGRKSVSILSNCITQNYGTDGINGNRVAVNPRFLLLQDIDGPDNIMFTADDGIRLAACSPAINAGNNSNTSILPTDILGQNRFIGTTVDMGAYEYQSAAGASRSFYVDELATGNKDGSSWQDAFTDLQAAVCNVCTDTIRIAAGTYKPAATDRDSSFYIDRPMTIYGGYPSGGGEETERKPFENPTILSGNIGNLLDSMDNTRTILLIGGVIDSVTIDGVIVRDGTMDEHGIVLNQQFGAGIYSVYNHTIIRNCQFIKNTGNFYGAGLCFGSLSYGTVSNSIFSGNSSEVYGGALNSRGDSLIVTNCVFEKNFSYSHGGAFSSEAGTLKKLRILNSVFLNNYTTVNNSTNLGGAIYAGTGGGMINNCTFIGNQTITTNRYAGGAVYLGDNRSMAINNCIFNGNITAGSVIAPGSDVYWSGGMNLIKNNIVQSAKGTTVLPNIITLNPGFVDSLHPKGGDNKWMTEDDGLQLNYNAAAIDKGINTAVDVLDKDILGRERIINNIVDLGAYEYQNLPVAYAGKDTSICTGSSATIGRPANPGHSYSWTSSPAGFVSALANPIVSPAVETTYFLEAGNGALTSRDTIKVTPVASLVPSVAIQTDTTLICSGRAVTFLAIPVNEGETPSYQWKVNGVDAGNDSISFKADSLAPGAKVFLVMNTSATCATIPSVQSNIIDMNVIQVVTPAVVITSPVNSLCSPVSVTFTATPTDGGPQPSYKWYKGGLRVGTNGNSYTTDKFLNGDAIFTILTSNAACAEPPRVYSNIIAMAVNTPVTPTIAITASDTTICSGSSVSFSGTYRNGGAAPQFHWKVNGQNAGTSSSNFTGVNLANGDRVWLELTSNAVCAVDTTVISNIIRVTVTETKTVSAVISGPTALVQGQIAEIIATVVNAGNSSVNWQDSSATHSWQKVSGGSLTGLSYTPSQTGDGLRLLINNTQACLTPPTVISNTLVFSVTPLRRTNGPSVYPNPVTTDVTIDSLNTGDEWQTAEVIDMNGHQAMLLADISHQSRIILRTGQLAKGLYVLRLRRKNKADVYLTFIKM